MKQIPTLMFAVILLIGNSVQAADLDTIERARELTDQVMAKVGSGDMQGGLLLMKQYCIIPESEFNVFLEQTKLRLPAIELRFGKTIGSELISEKAVGKSLLQIIQIQKFERHAMIWRFIFYNAGEKWVINIFNFDDKILTLFDE